MRTYVPAQGEVTTPSVTLRVRGPYYSRIYECRVLCSLSALAAAVRAASIDVCSASCSHDPTTCVAVVCCGGQVASFNAANVWMMESLASLLLSRGKPTDASQATSLQKAAELLSSAVLQLYVDGKP